MLTAPPGAALAGDGRRGWRRWSRRPSMRGRHARAVASGGLFAPIVYAETRGSNVVDVDGNLYIDLTAGFGAVLLGHRAQAVDDAIRRGMNTSAAGARATCTRRRRRCSCSSGWRRSIRSPGARAMLGLSGADAVTAALKTALLATGQVPGSSPSPGATTGCPTGRWRRSVSSRVVPHAVRGAALVRT